MAADDMGTPTDDSALLRAEGNDLYKEGKIEAAISLYQRSAELSPTDPAPLSNLSASHFELGDYAAAASACDQALAFQKDDAKREKLAVRKAKSHLFSLDYQAVRDALEFVPAGDEQANMFKAVQNAKKSQDAVGDVVQLRARLVNELPRCKPELRNVPEYYVQFSLEAFLSFYMDKVEGQLPTDRTFHFTICDIKPAVIARDILIYGILSDLADCGDDMRKQVHSLTIPLLYYTFLAPVMPGSLYELLQKRIKLLIETLEAPGSLRSEVINVPHMYRPAILKVLRQWQGEAVEQYSTTRVRKEVIRQRAEDRANLKMHAMQYNMPGSESLGDPPKGCKKEEAFYRKTGVLIMCRTGRDTTHEPEVEKAYADFDPRTPDRLDTTFLDKVDRTWKANPTFVDLDWRQELDSIHDDTNVGSDPFRFGHEVNSVGVAAPQKQGLLSMAAPWFSFVARGLQAVKPRLRIECCIGDITAVLEQIRIGAVGHRRPDPQMDTVDDSTQSAVAEASQKSDLDEFPKTYDRIHLSNIPDYIGGTFATFLYAVPVLHPGKQCYSMATCLRNPPRFKTHVHFDHEYLAGLSSPSDLAKAFHVRTGDLPKMDLPYPMANLLPAVIPFPETGYLKWHQQPLPRKLSCLLLRQQMELWLYRFFLKICIPMARQMRDMKLIYSPLNLTAFVRLCGHLHDMSYPAHWLSGVLEDICSGTISTKARPPRSDPLTFKETKTQFPTLQQSTAPFVAELTTLLSMWRLALPFGIPSPHVPSIQLVHQYSFVFPSVSGMIDEPPAFILVLFSPSLMPKDPGRGYLRGMLLSDETGSKAKKAKNAREEGIHIISTWKWSRRESRREKRATFWLRKDILDELNHSTWALSIWRTDSWVRQAGPEVLDDGLTDQGTWIDITGNSD